MFTLHNGLNVRQKVREHHWCKQCVAIKTIHNAVEAVEFEAVLWYVHIQLVQISQ